MNESLRFIQVHVSQLWQRDRATRAVTSIRHLLKLFLSQPSRDFRGDVSALSLVVGKLLLVIIELYCQPLAVQPEKRGSRRFSKLVSYFAAKCLLECYVSCNHFCTIRSAKYFFYNISAQSFNIKELYSRRLSMKTLVLFAKTAKLEQRKRTHFIYTSLESA